MKNLLFWNIFRVRSTFILFTVFLCLGTTAYFVTHLYLETTSYQTMLNWYASQSVELQEGNFLSAVTKIQRMKSSNDYIKGVLLLDQSLQKQGELIQFGKKVDQSLLPNDLKEITVRDTGFFEQYVMMPLPKRPSTMLVFIIQSVFLRNIFLGLGLGLCVLFGIFRVAILSNRNAEIQKREAMIKDSLGALLNQGKTSSLLEKEHPELVSWWSEKKDEFESAQASLAESKTQVLFAKMAAQVAHDIRSPLGALNTAIENLERNQLIDHSTLKFAAERLNRITDDLIKNRGNALPAEVSVPVTESRVKTQKALSDTAQLKRALVHLIREKECLYQHLSGVSFALDFPAVEYEAICFDADQLARHLSNLIDNSVEAIPLKGSIQVSIQRTEDTFAIKINDNGAGIPPAILERFGELGNTSKSNGTGMGVHHTLQFVNAHSGRFNVDSELGRGTSIQIELPVLKKRMLVIKKAAHFAFLDDDPLAHLVWRDFLSNQGMEAAGFYNFEDYQEWSSKNPDHVLFCDYDLRSTLNGLEILENSPQRNQSFLVTNSFDDPQVVAGASKLGVPLVPKAQLQDFQIAWV